MGIKDRKFDHYVIDSGENKGEPFTSIAKSELDRTMNVENRGNGITTRYGSTVLNVNGSGYPDPIATNPDMNSIKAFQYGTNSFDALFTGTDSIYRNVTGPIALKTGLTPDLDFQFQQAGDIMYATNGTDDVFYYDPNRSTSQMYTAGYDTPATFTATPSALGGSMDTGDYEYFAILYDANTETKQNRQETAVTAAVVGPTGSVVLTDLPLDPEDRSSHWLIYRKDPTGYYHFKIATVPYDAIGRTYTDTDLLTGTSEVVANDNDRPDPATCVCLHEKLMVYAAGSTIQWSKNYQQQDVPTYNRDRLDDNSQTIVKMVSFRGTLVIWKTDSIFVVKGDLNGSYTISKISGVIGTRSPDTVKENPDGIFFFDSNGRPRFINSTDFNAEDLRDSTDIAYKYRRKFESIPKIQYANCFAVLWETSSVSQYRIFVPIETTNDTCDQCYVFDYGLARRNGGNSAWFDFAYNMNLKCADNVTAAGGEKQIYAGDDYGLIWRLDYKDVFFDGTEYWREEGDGTVTFGVSTVDISAFSLAVDEVVGMQVLIYNRYTYELLFRSKITANTATELTLADTIPDLGTDDPFITIGGYLAYFATANYTHDHSGKNRPVRAKLLFSDEYHATVLQFFIHYDGNQVFNYTYDYINNPANQSLTPLADNYDLVTGDQNAFYDDAIYDSDSYSAVLFGSVEFPLNSKYQFKHASWGLITRQPSQPFGYLGSTIEYQAKGSSR